MLAALALPLLPLFLTQAQPSFRSDVALVHIDAEARTQTGAVTGLQRDDFLITDNTQPQKILNFASDEQPLDIILLFDTSDSMRPAVARVAEAAHSALDELKAGDHVTVMAFDNTTDLIGDFAEDFAAAEKSIREQVLGRQFRCCTPIQAALANAVAYFSGRPAANFRRSILIVTDDHGTSEYQNAFKELWAADVVVAGVVVGNSKVSFNGPVRPALSYRYFGMRNLAVRTGGDSIDANDAADGVREMIHRLRSRYSLYYALPAAAPGEERSVQVQLTPSAAARHPGAIVRARTGYIVLP